MVKDLSFFFERFYLFFNQYKNKSRLGKKSEKEYLDYLIKEKLIENLFLPLSNIEMYKKITLQVKEYLFCIINQYFLPNDFSYLGLYINISLKTNLPVGVFIHIPTKIVFYLIPQGFVKKTTYDQMLLEVFPDLQNELVIINLDSFFLSAGFLTKNNLRKLIRIMKAENKNYYDKIRSTVYQINYNLIDNPNESDFPYQEKSSFWSSILSGVLSGWSIVSKKQYGYLSNFNLNSGIGEFILDYPYQNNGYAEYVSCKLNKLRRFNLQEYEDKHFVRACFPLNINSFSS